MIFPGFVITIVVIALLQTQTLAVKISLANFYYLKYLKFSEQWTQKLGLCT